MSLILHEAAHLVYKEHNGGFILLLKYMLARATQQGLFDPREKAEVKSRHRWERALYETGGFISRKYLGEPASRTVVE